MNLADADGSKSRKVHTCCRMELWRVKAVLQANFPGLAVETRAFEEMSALRQAVLGPDGVGN